MTCCEKVWKMPITLKASSTEEAIANYYDKWY